MCWTTIEGRRPEPQPKQDIQGVMNSCPSKWFIRDGREVCADSGEEAARKCANIGR